ncbi:MAG: MarR family winged helix-turn-helix transcriptional regulator [Muribaculaceae bacterium]|nr:MarR family winged helix-turn-helix transcriptional regulator [Muribaculaceae bacterium]
MKNDNKLYGMPNTGCMVGTAYQVLLSSLSERLSTYSLNLTPPEYMVLRSLYTCDGMQQCELAAMIGKDKGAVCRCVATMVKKGLVRTESVSHKCLRVYVAPLGRDIEPKVMAVAREQHEALTSLLTPEEMTTFDIVLKKIINNSNQNKKG